MSPTIAIMNNKVTYTEHGFFYKPTDVFNDKATRNKIDRHLLDINDVISEDDIRNIQVSFPANDNFGNHSNKREEIGNRRNSFA